MLYGGLPPIMNISSPEEKISFLKSLFEETYISDIVGRHNVRNRAGLEELLNILSSAIGSLTNPTKLSAAFKSVKQKTISNTTIKRYIDYLCDSFLIDSAVRYDIKGKKYIDTPVKYSFTDYAIPDQAKMEQEQRSLMLTGDFFKKIIITKDAPAPYYNDNGVLAMSVYDFLLNEDSLDN